MNKREAKIAAYEKIASLITHWMMSGETDSSLSEADQEKINQEIAEFGLQLVDRCRRLLYTERSR